MGIEFSYRKGIYYRDKETLVIGKSIDYIGSGIIYVKNTIKKIIIEAEDFSLEEDSFIFEPNSKIETIVISGKEYPILVYKTDNKCFIIDDVTSGNGSDDTILKIDMHTLNGKKCNCYAKIYGCGGIFLTKTIAENDIVVLTHPIINASINEYFYYYLLEKFKVEKFKEKSDLKNEFNEWKKIIEWLGNHSIIIETPGLEPHYINFKTIKPKIINGKFVLSLQALTETTTENSVNVEKKD